MVLKPNSSLAASQSGALRGPEIDLEHSFHIYKHGLSPECFFNISEAACDRLRWFRCSGEGSGGR